MVHSPLPPTTTCTVYASVVLSLLHSRSPCHSLMRTPVGSRHAEKSTLSYTRASDILKCPLTELVFQNLLRAPYMLLKKIPSHGQTSFLRFLFRRYLSSPSLVVSVWLFPFSPHFSLVPFSFSSVFAAFFPLAWWPAIKPVGASFRVHTGHAGSVNEDPSARFVGNDTEETCQNRQLTFSVRLVVVPKIPQRCVLFSPLTNARVPFVHHGRAVARCSTARVPTSRGCQLVVASVRTGLPGVSETSPRRREGERVAWVFRLALIWAFAGRGVFEDAVGAAARTRGLGRVVERNGAPLTRRFSLVKAPRPSDAEPHVVFKLRHPRGSWVLALATCPQSEFMS